MAETKMSGAPGVKKSRSKSSFSYFSRYSRSLFEPEMPPSS
jgi:hypothetical protein